MIKKTEKKPLYKAIAAVMPAFFMAHGSASVRSVSRVASNSPSQACISTDKPLTETRSKPVKDPFNNYCKSNTANVNQTAEQSDQAIISFLESNGLLKASKTATSHISGDLSSLTGRKTFTSCTYWPSLYTTELVCTGAGHTWNGGGGNNAPTNIGLSANSINQSATGAGAVVGDLSTTDADGGDTHTYSLVSNGASGSGSCGASGDDDNASFQVDNANDDLETAGSVTAGTYNVCAQTHDGTDSYQKTFSITVNDNVAPSFQNSTPSVSATSYTQTTLTVRLDEIGSAYYVVVVDGAGAPSSAQVKTGQDSGGSAAFKSGTLNITTASQDFNTNITGLSPGTAYDIYVVAQDDEGTPNLQASATKVDVTTTSPDSDGNLTASAVVTEPVAIPTTVDTIGEAVDVFDFTLSDGGGGDGLPMSISQIVLNVTGTASDAIRDQVTWRLDGPDTSNVTGTYNAGADTITFSALSISIADSGNETYTVNAYYNDNTGLTEDQTFILSVDGDTDVTTSDAGTAMGATSAVNNGIGSTVDVTATGLAFTTQPASSTSGSALGTQPVVTAQDAFGNTDVDFTETVTLSEASVGTLSGDVDIAAVAGVTTFTDVAYTATADQESFTLTANDQDGVGTDLSTVDANAVTSDVVATKLLVNTQPAPTTMDSGSSTDFTTDPVVQAVDANNTLDTGYSTNIVLSVTDPSDGTVDGTVNSMSGTGDADGDGTTVTLTPSSGTATFTGLALQYTNSGASESIALKATSGGLTAVNSNTITSVVNNAPAIANLDSDSVFWAGIGNKVALDSGGDATASDTELDALNGANGDYSGGSLTVQRAGGAVTSDILGFDTSGALFTVNGSDLQDGGQTFATFTNTNGVLTISFTSSGTKATTALVSDVIQRTTYRNDTLAGDATVRFTLSDGMATGSADVTVEDIAPTVSSVSVPANATYVAGQNLDFAVNTSEDVAVNTGGGTPRIALTVGATTRYATYLSGSGTSAIMFRYTIQAGDSDTDGIALAASLDTNGGTLRDSGGNDLNNTLNVVGNTSGVLVDAVAPVGHSVSFDDSTINNSEAGSTSFTFAGAEVGANYSYSISSSGGGTDVTGSGTLTATGDQISNVNVSGLSDGTLTLSVTLTDSAGNSAAAVSDTASLDVTTPAPAISSAISDPTNSTFTATIDFGEVVTGFVTDDITADNATLSGLTDNGGGSYSVTVTPTADGSVTLDVAAGVAQDTAGNANTAATQLSRVYDASAPMPGISSNVSGTATNEAFIATVDFGEAVTGFIVGDIATDNASLSGFTDNGSGNYSVTVTPSADGNVTLDVAANAAQDNSGNNSLAATQFSLTYDGTAPTLESSSPADNADNVAFDTDIVLSFSENVTAGAGSVSLYSAEDDSLVESVTASDLTITGPAATVNLSGNLTPTQNYYIQIDATAFADEAGNGYVGIADTTTLNFTIDNNAPAATNDTATVNEDEMVQIDVLGNDTDADSALNVASVQVTSAPANGNTSVNTATGVITYTPAANFNGNNSFSYTVEDVHGAVSNTATVNVTVTAVNDAPVAVNDLISTPEDNAIVIDVAENDTDIDVADSAVPSTIIVVGAATNGTTSISEGVITYTPAADFNGTDSFTYTIEDQNGATSNTATVVVNVTGVNDLPIAADDTATLDEDTTVVLDILDNDADADGSIDVGTVLIMTNAANGTASVDVLTGTVTYTPDANYHGTDSFTYVVRDNDDGTSNLATVSLSISSVNDAPVANADAASLQEDTPHEINVLGNDTDVDGTLDATSVEVVSAALSGTTSVDAITGAVTYSPGADFHGSDSFSYRVKDNEGVLSAPAVVTLAVTALNDAPLANNDLATTHEDSPVIINLAANDSDVDGSLDLGGISIVDQPLHGVLTDNADGTLTYTPQAEYAGSDNFTYTIPDNEGAVSNTATVTVTISTVNDAPQISGIPATDVDQGATYNFTPTTTDADGDTLTFSISNKPVWATFNASSGELTGTPSQEHIGTTSGIVISVSDGSLSAQLPAFSLTVANVNDAPAISGSPATSVPQNGVYSFIPSASDPDGDALTFSISNKPAWAAFSTATGALQGRPTQADVGTTTGIVITVSDGSLSSSLPAFSLVVVNVNDGPVISGSPATSVDQDIAYLFTPMASDVDGDTLTFSISNKPAWAEFNSSTGMLAGTPRRADVGTTEQIVISVTDGQSVASLPAFSLQVMSTNEAPIANNDQLSVPLNAEGRYSLDVLANDTDPDADSLSISAANASIGSVQVQAGQLVYTVSDNVSGTVTLRYSITDGEFTDTADVILLIEGSPAAAPVITQPEDKQVNATGLFTKVNVGVATAVDATGNPIAVSLVNGAPLFAPGEHKLYWRATDANGVSTTVTQLLQVMPQVSLSKAQTVLNNTTASFDIILNGNAPAYPVEIGYTVSGSAQSQADHSLVSDTIVLHSGTHASVSFDLFADLSAISSKDIVVTLDPALNLGANASTTITVTEANLAPTVILTAKQQNSERLTFAQDEGEVTISALANDANPADSITLLWQADAALHNLSGSADSFIFDPSNVPAGIYRVAVTATDSATPALSKTAELYLQVSASLPVLTNADSNNNLIPDNVEGFGDANSNGIPDYLDPGYDCNVIPENISRVDAFVAEGEPGICLRKGSAAAVSSSGGIELDSDDQQGLEPDLLATNIGGVFDFILLDLPVAGESYRMVLPQQQPLPQQAIYRKYSSTNGWVDFVSNEHNQLFSSAGEPGYCPPPGDSNWQAGLTAGHWCVQLQIEDGGPNDADGMANGSIVDPGGIAVALNGNQLPVTAADTYNLQWNQTHQLEVLVNDSDPDGDVLTINQASANFGAVSISDDGLSLWYTPQYDYIGPDSLSYSVTDGNGGSASATAAITVYYNRAPVVTNSTASTDDRTAITLDVLAGATDADADVLTIDAASALQGSVSITAEQKLQYVPRTGFSGIDVVSFSISDNRGGMAQGEVKVAVTAYEVITVENTSSGGANGYWSLLLLSLLIVLRRLPAGLLGSAVLAVFSFSAQANWSVDAQLGQNKARLSRSDVTAQLPANTTLSDFDNNSSSWAVGASYALSDTLALQLHYLDLGSTSLTIQGDTVTPTQFHQAVSGVGPLSAEGIRSGLSYRIWQGDSWQLAVQAGGFVWQSEQHSQAGDTVIRNKVSDTDLYWALSAGYQLSEKLSIQAIFNRYLLESNKTDNLMLGLSYHF